MTPSNPRFSSDVVRAAAEHLEIFTIANPGVQLAVLTSNDGFEVASFPPNRAMTTRIAAMSSSMQALSDALTREAHLSRPRSLIVETDTGTVLVLGLEETASQMSLAVVAASSELLGKLLWSSRNLCETLERSLHP